MSILNPLHNKFYSKTKKHFTWGAGLALVVIVFLVFGKSVGFGFVPYDDPAYVTQNGYISKGFTKTGVKWAFFQTAGGQEVIHRGAENLWHPLTWLSHMADVSCFGVAGAWGHHFHNIFLHSLAGIFLMLTARKITGSLAAAFWIALLWSIHPLKVESVAWVSERKDVLSGMFFWAALWLILVSRERGKKWEWLAWMCFVCGLLSKASVVIFPGVLILVVGYIDKEKWSVTFFKQKIKLYRWFFVTSAVVSIITAILQQGGSMSHWASQSSLASRLMIHGAEQIFYLYRILYPANLTVDYPYPEMGSLGFSCGLLVIIAIAILAYLKRQQWPKLFFATAWWMICLLPVSGLFYVGSSFTSDRYLYLATAGPLFVLIPWIQKFGMKAYCLLVVVATGWSILSWQQTDTWRDGESLFSHMVKAQPKSQIGWNNLGTLYLQKGQKIEARRAYQKALDLKPNDHITLYNVANVLETEGQLAEALALYQKSLATNPGYMPSLQRVTILFLAQKEYEKAHLTAMNAFKITQGKNPTALWLCSQSALKIGNRDQAMIFAERLEIFGRTSPAWKKRQLKLIKEIKSH